MRVMMMMMTIIIGVLGMVPRSLGKKTARIENQRKNQDHPDHSIIKLCQDTEKSPGDLKRLTVTQIFVKDHQLMLV